MRFTKMAAFQHLTAQQQYVSSFVNNNAYPVTETAGIPPSNLLFPPSTQPNNAEVFSVGRKRKTPDDQQLNGVPFMIKQPAQQFFCEICNVQLNSLSQASQHREGKIHKLNATKRDLLNSVSLYILCCNPASYFSFPSPTKVNNLLTCFHTLSILNCFILAYKVFVV